MATPFAAIEAALASTAVAALSNASATIGASSVEGVFVTEYAEALDVAAGSKPVFHCVASALPSITLGTTTAVINSTTYTIVESHPDGTGMTLLVLEAT